MSTPTRVATAGIYKSQGEDFVQYTNARGVLMARTDYSGTNYGTDFQSTAGVSLNALQQQVDNIPIGTDIDGGTF